MSAENLSRTHRNIIVGITLSGAFLSVLTQFLLITAFPKIMAEFTINSTEVQWLTTGYMLTVAVLIPITGYFIDRFPTRNLMLGAMFLFFAGTLIGLLAPNFSVLLTGRIIQGMGSGIMIPLMQTILFLVFPRDKRGFAMGLAGLVINVAPAVGPPISGILVQLFEWRSLFWVTLPIAAIILVLIYIYMRNITDQRETNIDILSILLSTIGFGGMLYGFNQIEDGSIGALSIITMGAGALSLALFVIRQIKLKTPILEMRVLKEPLVSLVTVISVVAFTLLVSNETILPMFVQNAQQMSAFYGGIIVMPGALTLAFMSLFAGRLFDKYGGRMIALVGFTLLVLSSISFYFAVDVDTPFILTMFLFMIAMAGVGLINMPIMTAGINSLPDELIPHGTAVINTARQFGGSLGLTFIISFISRAESGAKDIDPEKYLTGVENAFFVAFIFAVVGLALSYFIDRKKNKARVRE